MSKIKDLAISSRNEVKQGPSVSDVQGQYVPRSVGVVEYRKPRTITAEDLNAAQHLGLFRRCTARMHRLVDAGLSESERNEFAALKVLADLHWRVVDRYLPKVRETVAGEGESVGSALVLAQLMRGLALPGTVPPNPPEAPQIAHAVALPCTGTVAIVHPNTGEYTVST